MAELIREEIDFSLVESSIEEVQEGNEFRTASRESFIYQGGIKRKIRIQTKSKIG